MKTRISSALVFLAVLGAASVRPLPAAPALPEPAKAYPLGAVERYGIKAVQTGVATAKVLAYLGRPDGKLDGDTWVYRRFHCQDTLVDATECTTLVISFRHGRVSELKRVNAAAVPVIAAQLAAPAAPRLIIAAK